MAKRTVRVNPDPMLGRLAVAVQQAMDLVAVGLVCVDAVDEPPVDPLTAAGVPVPPLRIPGVAFQVGLGAGLSFEDARVRFRPWLLGCGLRDCIEAVSLFLDELRVIAAIFSFGGAMTGEDWQRAVDARGPEAKKFHFMGLKDRLTYLVTKYDASLSSEFDSDILSINQTRNCLVHRLGLISPRDVGTGSGSEMRLTWRRNEILIRDEATGEERRMEGFPFLVEGQSTVLLRPNVRTEKAFALGSRVELTAQEFADIAYTVFIYGQDLRTKVLAYGRAKGIPEAPRDDEPQAGSQ